VISLTFIVCASCICDTAWIGYLLNILNIVMLGTAIPAPAYMGLNPTIKVNTTSGREHYVLDGTVKLLKCYKFYLSGR